MIAFLIILFSVQSLGLKTWKHNTDVNNKLNWDKLDTPKNCDHLSFKVESDIAAFWNVKDIELSGVSLPPSFDVIFPQNSKIKFKDKKKCSQVRDLNYVRNNIKSWLNPDNWESDSKSEWLPHSERVPCAGEPVVFPSKQTFSVELPSILLPSGDITLDNEVFRGETWPEFLKTDLGYQFFKGSDEMRSLPWRNDIGCAKNKKCTCVRSSYIIEDGTYKEVNPEKFQDAVCLQAKPNCEISDCYSPVIPEGHCCGICGAVLKLEDKTETGIDLGELKKQVQMEIKENGFENDLKTYVGGTLDDNVQIVIVAEDPSNTIKSHILSSILKAKLIGQRYYAMSSEVSGLTLSKYIFNSVSGIVFGTLFAVIFFFVAIFYIYNVLPKKKKCWQKNNEKILNFMRFQRPSSGNPFTFVRFENTLQEASSEENLEIGIEPKSSERIPKAFDNPMYSQNLEPSTSKQTIQPEVDTKEVEDSVSEKTLPKEYSNPVYAELEKPENLDVFQSFKEPKEEEFSEVKL